MAMVIKSVLFAGVVAIASVALLNNASADTAADVAALHAADETIIKAFNSNDVEGLVALYDEHAVLLPEGSGPQNGRDQIKAYFTKDLAESAKEGISLKIRANPTAGVSGNWGWTSGSLSVSDKSGKVLATEKFLTVSHKRNGKWLKVRDMWNADTPAPAAAPAVSAKK